MSGKIINLIKQVTKMLKLLKFNCFNFIVLLIKTTCYWVIFSGYNQYKTSEDYMYRYVLPEIAEYKRTLTFRVMAASDAHIALSPSKDSDDIYEIGKQ